MKTSIAVIFVALTSSSVVLVTGCPAGDDAADSGNEAADTGGDDGGPDDGGPDDGGPDDGGPDDGGPDDGGPDDGGPDDGGPDDGDETGDDGGDPIAGECALGQRVGNFDVLLEDSYSAIDGEIREFLVQTAILTEGASEGDCKLIKSEFPFCDPPCSGGDACTADGCMTFPARATVGTVTVNGLEAEAVMEPAADSRYFKTDLPHPAIAPGADIELVAAGGDNSGFTMQGAGFGALTVTSEMLTIAPETPIDIEWEPEGGRARVRIEINIDQHGTSPSTLFCDVEDNGSYQVPASVVDALIASGTSGFPSGNLYRQTVDSTNTDNGCVEFRIRGRTPVSVGVEGHTPCNGPGECPEGQTCNIPIQTCQ